MHFLGIFEADIKNQRHDSKSTGKFGSGTTFILRVTCLVCSKQFGEHSPFLGKIAFWGFEGDCEAGVTGVLEWFLRINLDGNFLENPMVVVLERQGGSFGHEIELILGL